MRRSQQIAWVVAVVFCLVVPLLFSETRVNLAIEVLIYALFAVSFNLLFGYGGILPLGHSAVFGVGAYCTALICNRVPGFPLPLTLLAAAVSGLIAGAFIGVFCARLKGTYAALLSIAFQMFLFAVAIKWTSLTNGDDGMGVTRPDPLFARFGNAVSHEDQLSLLFHIDRCVWFSCCLLLFSKDTCWKFYRMYS